MLNTRAVATAVTLVAVPAFGPSVYVAADGPTGKPDILLIVADDMG